MLALMITAFIAGAALMFCLLSLLGVRQQRQQEHPGQTIGLRRAGLNGSVTVRRRA
jgi:hypothetical protein